VDGADEVVMVDLTPEALRNRIQRGAVYRPEKAAQAMDNFFNEANLRALRELALRNAAHDVEGRLERERPVLQRGDADRKELILACITGRPTAALLIRRAKRVADYLGARCVALHVEGAGELDAETDRDAVAKHLGFARSLRIDTEVVEASDAAAAIAAFARERGATQIFVGRPERARRWAYFRRSTLHQLTGLARDFEITIVAAARREGRAR
jgi:two-component system, OmpR family, sensor histidine kinase KdpD